ncbi:hypothetical protein IQ22_02945 [Pseudomonas duriflava]|uniref:DUF1853 family protein n=1 Tax=Pseudomonas duriflava TaxID=459528 RepID=A0A562Q8N0_9PSED|nr:DUF1853 family protein [Pseudomonas duriflava]TWI53102.1 hypothetical protein IQ22_02945 [Pseudomonas duriflava]
MPNPFASIADLPSMLRTPAVRDLAWVLTSPPLLDLSCQRHPLAASDWTAKPWKIADWLCSLDRDPAVLEYWLTQGNDRRLGRHYEQLWQFALTQAPGVSLLGANIPIRVEGHTLGELDLLVQDQDGIHHLEIAVKYYLATGSTEQPVWLGPGARDRLDIKRSHLITKQLPLSTTTEAQALLTCYSEAPVRAWLWMSGYLFYPIDESMQAPQDVNPAHLRGAWYSQMCARNQLSGCWWKLPKQRWLAPATSYEISELYDVSGTSIWPQLIVQLDDYGRESHRAFIVPDSWPDH